MKIWISLPNEEIFQKSNITDMMELTKWCEKYTSNKEAIMAFVKIPFDIKDEVLRATWETMFTNFINDEPANIDGLIKIHYEPYTKDMEHLEFQYKFFDLLYNYCSKFEEEHCEKIIEIKHNISCQIINILKEKKFTKRKCKYCGRELAWNYPYSMCDSCHSKRYRNYYDDDYDYWQ